MSPKTMGAALGKLFNKAKDSEFWIAKGSTLVTSIFVINPVGKKVKAFFQGHLHHEDHESKIGDVFHCSDGHEYISVNGKVYNHDLKNEIWYDSTDKS